MSRIQLTSVLLCLLVGGVVLRFWDLDERPMHTDEAVHAVKLTTLLEEGRYEYEPQEYHGPTLYYISATGAYLFGISSGELLTNAFLRSIPAVAGLLLILTPFFFSEGLGKRAMLIATGLLAFSPAFTYYSRYFIHEIFLVLFMAGFLGCLWKYCQIRKAFWLLLAGLLGGLMIATKETSLLCLISMAMAGIFVFAYRYKNGLNTCETRKGAIGLIAVAIGIAGVVWILLYSSFGTHWQGPIDSLRYFMINIQHAQGQNGHQHPWYYYLNLLTWIEFVEPISWNEDGIIALAILACLMPLLGMKASVPRKDLLVFVVWFTLILTIIYSAIPYKTPWNVLSFLYGMALLAGVAADSFLKEAKSIGSRISVVAVLSIFCFVSPIVQSAYLNFKFSADLHNPYVYGHTGYDISYMEEQVKQVADSSNEGKDLYIQIFASDDDYWPWPWILRDYPNVGYWNQLDSSVLAAPLVLAHSQLEPEILRYLYELPPPGKRNLYMSLFDRYTELRPGVEWRGYIRKDYWDRMQQGTEANSEFGKDSITAIKMEHPGNQIHKFSHNAMASTFEIFIDHRDRKYAQSVSKAVFDEIDRLEQNFSRHLLGSDVSRINQLAKGQSATVSPETIECLKIALFVNELTAGVFDVTLGRLVDLWKEGAFPSEDEINKLKRKTGQQFIQIDTEALTVTVLIDQITLDLGGIGKGYAIDRAAKILREWNIKRAMVHGGASSVLAMDLPAGSKKGWQVRLSNFLRSGEEIMVLNMRNQALSCSGLRRKTDMIDPDSGRAAQNTVSTWILGPDAAICDALSTACMIMNAGQIKELHRKAPEYGIMVLPVEKQGKASLLNYGFQQ